MSSRLPQHQHRGVILPMLSSTIKSADLNDVCTVAIDPGVRSELTASFVKFSSFDDDNTLNISSFCKCFKHFGKATQSGDPSDSRRGCLRCERQRHRHRRHRHRRISVDAFLFVCLFFTVGFQFYVFFFFFFFFF
jgi:hypothetical protein